MKPELFDKLVTVLRDPKEEWIVADYTIRHTLLGIEVWTSNVPVLDTSVYNPCGVPLSLVQKWKLWRAVKAACENCLERRLLKALNPLNP